MTPPRTDLSAFEPPQAHTREEIDSFRRTWDAPPGVLGWLRTVNNIPIARRFMITGFVFFLVGGVQALLMRWQLGTPENTFLDPETYNQIFTMHGTTMMFLFVIPFIEAIANYMMPLVLGTRDLPFPRLTALSYWTYVLGGTFLYASFLWGVAPNGGWFAYVPLTNAEYSPGINMDWWDIGLSVAEIAAMGAAAELIISILRMRAAGMSLRRMPVYVWSMLVTAVMIIFAFTPLIVATLMLELDRKGLTAFFVPGAGGEPLLWQHLFWIFGHPDVYIMFIPAIGIVSQIVQTFSRRPLVGYPFVVLGMIAVGFLSFGLWVHHMFTTGLSPASMGFFHAASIMIAIPSGVQVFCWIATLWTGTPIWRTPLLFVAGFIAIFVAGGLTGVMVSSVPFDHQVHDSYFVVAHFHYVLVGGVVFPLIAGLYYWLPKITGRMLSERLGRWNFWLMFVFFNVAFFPMHIAGLLGMARRVYTYPPGLGWELPNLIATIGAFGFACAVLLFVVNFFWSLRHGERVAENPWDGDTLEWSQSSPPPAAQFPALPAVRSRHPLWEQETLTAKDPGVHAALTSLDWRPVDFRAALVTTVVEARPLAIVHVPGPTIWPFVMAVGFVFIFAGALVDNLFAFLIGAGLTAVAILGWFRPADSEQRALEQFAVGADARPLPLAVAGPAANGWWGMVVILTILTVALACMLGSYFYLGDGPRLPALPAPPTRIWPPLAAVGLALAAAIALWRAGGTRPVLPRSAAPGALGAGLLFAAGSTATWIVAWRDWGIDPRASAAGSTILGLIGLLWIVGAILGWILATALVRALRSPRDPRVAGVTAIGALLGYFLAAAGFVVAAFLYLWPALW